MLLFVDATPDKVNLAARVFSVFLGELAAGSAYKNVQQACSSSWSIKTLQSGMKSMS